MRDEIFHAEYNAIFSYATLKSSGGSGDCFKQSATLRSYVALFLYALIDKSLCPPSGRGYFAVFACDLFSYGRERTLE